MKQIFDAVKSIHNPRSRYTAIDEDEQLNYSFYNGENDSSEDEGTNPPISVMSSSSRSSLPIVEPVKNPYSQLLNGYTNANCEINVYPNFIATC